jgi:hypothetical protein
VVDDETVMPPGHRRTYGPRRNVQGGTNVSAAPRKRPTKRTTGERQKRSPELKAAVERHEARIRELASLYQPVREAGDAQLAKTVAGKKMLRDARALGTRLSDIQKSIASGETAFGAGHKSSLERRQQFKAKYEKAFVKAYAPHARLQPSLDAVAGILHPQDLSQTPAAVPAAVWVAEIAVLQAVLLTPKPAAPADVGTVQQGLGDPVPPQPVHICLSAPYARRETREWTQLWGYTFASATKADGRIWVYGSGVAADGVGGASSAEGFVGEDIGIPAGFTGYELTINYEFTYTGSSYAVFGAASCGAGVTVRVDRGDGTPTFDTNAPLFSLVSPVIWGNGASGSGDAKLVVPFTRKNTNAGTVRVMVGAGAHGEAWALSALGSGSASLRVLTICIDSTM